MKKILITGASGFVGSFLCQELLLRQFEIIAAVRNERSVRWQNAQLQYEVVGNIDEKTDWSKALNDVDVVVHLAARAHVVKELQKKPLKEYRKINVDGTAQLAEMAALKGVRRFIYISSIGVNGRITVVEKENQGAYTEKDIPNPQEPYAVSKWEAEQALHDIADKTGLEVVVLRPPLIYGPNVKANFLKLIRICERCIPLPLKSVKNQRSMIYVGNLADAIITVLADSRANGKIYLVSDTQTMSTPNLINEISRRLDVSAKLFSFPPKVLSVAAKLLGKSKLAGQILESLVVSSSKIREELNWKPPYSMAEGLDETIKWYLEQKVEIR